MPFKPRHFAESRLLFAGVLALGCGQILDISEPTPRPTSTNGGQGGQVAEQAGAASVSGSGAMGGAAGEAGSGGESGGSIALAGQAGASGNEAVGGSADAGAGGGMEPAPVKACDLGELRCDPDSAKTPQVCNAFGQWLRNPAEGNDQDCAITCEPSTGKCAECADSDTSCNGNYVKTCVQGAWTQAPQPCSEFCKQGTCTNVSSCSAPALMCGSDSCCLSLNVDGGSFFRDDNTLYPATISSFSMDKYEVTVGRLTQFYNWLYSSQGAPPAAGAGKSPHIAADLGWDTSYPLPATSEDMLTMLSCPLEGGDPNATFLNPNQAMPANCVSFYVAYAFCIWDGGRLPTEAEWNYAAAGGADQRYYPWSDPPSSTSIDTTRANYSASGGQPVAVGSTPAGNGKYQQADLEGNVSEWTLDYADAYPESCSDCLSTTVLASRAVRGGTFQSPAAVLKVARRTNADPAAPRATLGFRCVHDL